MNPQRRSQGQQDGTKRKDHLLTILINFLLCFSINRLLVLKSTISHTVILYQAGVRKAAKETPAKAVVMVNPGIPSQASKPCRAAIIRAVRCQVAPARTCLRRDLVGSDCGTGKLKGYKAIRLYFMTDLGSYKR